MAALCLIFPLDARTATVDFFGTRVDFVEADDLEEDFAELLSDFEDARLDDDDLPDECDGEPLPSRLRQRSATAARELSEPSMYVCRMALDYSR